MIEADVESLRTLAQQQESQNDLTSARQSWIELWQLAPADAEALAAIERIAAINADRDLGKALHAKQQECDRLRLELTQQNSQQRDRETLIEELLVVGAALSQTCDLSALMQIILTASRKITNSDAGSIYLVEREQDRSFASFMVSQNASQPERSLTDFALPLDRQSLVGYVALTGKSLNLPDAHDIPADAPYRHHATFDKDINYYTHSVLVLPMQKPDAGVIGVMQLINRKIAADLVVTPDNATEVTQAYSPWEENILRSLASQAAISIDRNHIIEKQV